MSTEGITNLFIVLVCDQTASATQLAMYRQCFYSTLIFFRYRRPYLDGDWISLNSHVEKNIHLSLPLLSLSLSHSLSSLFVRNRYLVDAPGKIIPCRACVSNASTYGRTNIAPTQIYSDSSIAAANERFRTNEDLRARNGGLYRLAFAKSTLSTKGNRSEKNEWHLHFYISILFFACSVSAVTHRLSHRLRRFNLDSLPDFF